MRVGLEDEMRSGLFLQCNRILKEVSPKYFLTENVVMKKEDENVITKLMGVNPIRINSKEITAQMRDRLYWTNIPNISKYVNNKNGYKIKSMESFGVFIREFGYIILNGEYEVIE